MLQSFIDLNNRVIDRFSAEERENIGIHTCPGGDCDSVHSAEVPYEQLLPSMFKMVRFYSFAAGLILITPTLDRTPVIS